MPSIRIIKKIKAFFIRYRLHVLIEPISDYLIYLGYLSKLSKWTNTYRRQLKYDDFYNSKVRHRDRFFLYEQFVTDFGLKTQQVTYLEFGVGYGYSLDWWTKNNSSPHTQFWAFDTFVGLPEKYGSYAIGTFSQDGSFPDLNDDRITFIKGLFQDTLVQTIPRINFDNVLIIHVDGDLYSSALFVLTTLHRYMKKGDIIIFDEFSVPAHEFKAFDDFMKSFYIKLEPIGAINNYLQFIFIVDKP